MKTVSFHRPHDKIGKAREKGFAVSTKNLWNRNSTTGLDELSYSDPNRQNNDVQSSDITASFTEKIVKNQQNAENIKANRDLRKILLVFLPSLTKYVKDSSTAGNQESHQILRKYRNTV